ncbi:riboflavin synthase [Dialister pneumosintes]|jgi:riboflavin synthase, alpha subunit|uniref:Riboflavin synthase n=1 Tax=Dialister pneumosintes TaxID=39950 RepID=A0A1B3WD89_9FIRM|nr:riboflavin synthase [Dialister pneumosintes]AOH38902.1 riboflavin synthase subunit alpha [Dialister pneumosintes]MBS6479952.1 riboflavin synthase [Dialister sp.]RID94136.1 riboflavin synthase [Dialister pneumosintes]CDF26778.1 riboflavin synthase alpha subunit [Dialister sp. CAG:588]
MFTGIIEEIGVLKERRDGSHSCTLTVRCEKILEGTKIGDSIAVNGTCLTVTKLNADSFDVDVTPETMRRTAFSIVRVGSKLNLERALRIGDRLGGHLVSGHVDFVGKLIKKEQEGNAVNLTFSVPEQWMKYILAKGSIAIDGVSLTIAKKQSNSFFVSLIPHTGEMTILLLKQIGDPVNIECDCIGKYIEQLIGHNTSSSIGVTMDTLIAGGYKGHYGK